MSRQSINPSKSKDAVTAEDIAFEHPVPSDGQVIWQLVKDTGVLDVNSAYCYIILCDHFRKTCITARANNRLVGFVTGYVLPQSDDTLFIWQVAVAETMRGRGLAKRMILKLLDSMNNQAVNMLLATVSPSNTASLSLFDSLARSLGTEMKTNEGYSSQMFPGSSHEQEDFITVGPFQNNYD